MNPPLLPLFLIAAWVLPFIHALAVNRRKPISVGHGVFIVIVDMAFIAFLGVLYTVTWQNAPQP